MSEIDEILPTNDVIFKILFSDQKHPRVLIHFLNCVINPASPIVSVTIEQTELTPEIVTQKGVRLDIVAKTQDGEIISVEMQKNIDMHMKGRLLYYWSKLFAGQLKIGMSYSSAKRTVAIAILDFTLFKKDKRFWKKFILKEAQTNEQLYETDQLLELHFIEIGKMDKVREDSPITFWIEFFKDPYSEQVKSLCKFVPEIQEAKDLFEKAKADPKTQELIRLKENALREYLSGLADAKEQGIAEGEKIGLEKGIAEGLERGIEQERANSEKKLREEKENSEKKLKEEKITIAKMLLQLGDSIEKISKATGLSIAEIEGLKKSK